MSKIIKSEQCVETHPRQLPPLDVDSFFIIEEQERARRSYLEQKLLKEQENSNPEEMVNSPAETAAPKLEGKTVPSAITSSIETSQDVTSGDINLEDEISQDGRKESATNENDSHEDDIVITMNPMDRKRLASAMMDFEEKRPESKPKSPMRNEKKWSPPTAAKRESESIQQTGELNLEHIADVAATLESLLSANKEHSVTVTEKAVNSKETPISKAFRRETKDLEDEEAPIDKIILGPKQKAVLEETDRKADTIIHNAKDQADLILEGARQTAEKSIEKTKQQAETIITDANQEATKIVEEANQKVGVMLEEANQQIADIKDKAYQEGLSAGREAALATAKEELAEHFHQALTLIGEIESERIERVGSSEPELLKLAVAIAGKIIGEEIRLDRSCQVQIVHEALLKASTANSIVLRVHPDDMQFIKDNFPRLQSAFSSPKPLEIKEDSGIPTGNCFIETDRGNLDARIQSQLEQIMTELLKVGKIQ